MPLGVFSSLDGPWSGSVRHLLHLRVDSITTPPTIPTKLASRIPSGPSLLRVVPSCCPPLALERPVFFDRDENRASRPGIHLALVRQPTILTTTTMTTAMDEFSRSFLSDPVKRRKETALEIVRLEGRALKELSYVEYNGYVKRSV